MSAASDLAKYYRHYLPLKKSDTPGWYLSRLCQGKRGGCKHLEHNEEFGKGRMRHLIRYVPEGRRAA
jgi:hypothetical protein